MVGFNVQFVVVLYRIKIIKVNTECFEKAEKLIKLSYKNVSIR